MPVDPEIAVDNMTGRMVKVLSVLVLVALLAGCASKQERTEPAVAGFQFPEELVAASRPLKFLVMWYYRTMEAWPESRNDLVQFLKSLEAPLTLDSYPEIRFLKVSEEYIECRYVFDARRDLCDASDGKVPVYRVNGMFCVSRAETATDGLDHVGLETMLTLESMILPEVTPKAEQAVESAAGRESAPGLPAQTAPAEQLQSDQPAPDEQPQPDESTPDE